MASIKPEFSAATVVAEAIVVFIRKAEHAETCGGRFAVPSSETR
jgi:hypothetical protein